MEQTPENFSQSALNGAINNSQTTLVVTNASKFPTVPTFRLLIGNEWIKVTGVAGPTFTVVRGDGGTTAASHSDGDSVYGHLSKEAFEAIREEIITTGGIASFTATKKGRLYLPNDAPYIIRDDASALQYFGGMHGNYPVIPPIDGDFSWFNQGTTTKSTTGGYIYLERPGTGADSLSGREKTLPSSPVTITVNIRPLLPPNLFVMAGLYLRESGTGKIQALQIAFAGTGELYLRVTNWNSSSSYNSDAFSCFARELPYFPNWLQVSYTGTNIIWRSGPDPFRMQQLLSQSKTAFFTSGADKCGIYVNANHATAVVGCSWSHWKEE